MQIIQDILLYKVLSIVFKVKTDQLFDEELNDYNEWGTYIISLKDEIKEYKDNKRRLSSYSVASSTDVDYCTADGYSFALLRCSYNVIQGK